MATATEARVFTAKISDEERDALSLRDLKAYQKFLSSDMDPVKKRMKELEEENRRLRKMYVEEKLKAEVVSEALAKKW